MAAFGLALVLFFYFLLVGSAVVRALHASRSVVQDLLISPVVGAVVTLLPIFFINRMLNVPVGKFGPVVAVVMVLLAVTVHLLRYRQGARLLAVSAADGDLHREVLPYAGPDAESVRPARGPIATAVFGYLPFLVILLIAAYLIGKPMLSVGFDWLSFCNDDMANYTLAADRFLRNGFLDVPASTMLTNGTDYSQTYWFFHVPSMVRAGSELLLAWTCSLTGAASHQVFMPLIVSFHLALISVGTALIYSSEDRRPAAIVAAILLAASAQITFGTVYQLIAQNIGLAVLAVNCILLFRPFEGLSRGNLIRHGVLLAIGMSGQFLIYPEVNPFLAAGFFMFLVASAFRRKLRLKPLIAVLAIGTVFTVIFLNAYMYDAMAFMYNQRTQAAQQDDPRQTLFPFFLIPSGFANFWGFVQITSMPPEPWFSVAIIIGALLSLFAVGLAVWLTWRGEPAAAVSIVCVVLAIVLFRTYSGFGLYKLAMFAQPFILPTLALGWFFLVKRFRFPKAVWLLALLALPSARVQSAYVGYSRDVGGSTFNEVLGATRTRVLQEFRGELREALKEQPNTSHILCDSYNISLTKMLASYTRGEEAAFPASRLTLQAAIPNAPPSLARQSYIDNAMMLAGKTQERIHEVFFEFDPARGRNRETSARFFFYDQGGRPSNARDGADTLLVAGTKNISMFNRRYYSDPQLGNFVMKPLGDVKNHLMFVETFFSQPYYKAGDPTYISVYQLERDPLFYTTSTMAGIGRYFVFEVLNPDEEVRFCLDFTMTFKSDGQNKLPPAVAVGTERKPFPLVGRGACRVFSPPIKPQMHRGRYYVGIDLGEFGTQFNVGRTGIMNIFGMEVWLDRRLLVGFGRDISLVNEAQYKALQPPSGVEVWTSPESELRHTDLEFSGFCEDGWIAETGYITLGQKKDQTKLVLRGFIPDLGNPSFSTRLTAKVDGQPVTFTGKTNNYPLVDNKLVVGRYELEADVPYDGPMRRKIELDWSAIQQFQDKDTRRAAARVEVINFEAPPKLPTTAPVAGK